jgi:PAS domain-containing protein
MAVAYPLLKADGSVDRVFTMAISLEALNKVIADHINAAGHENDTGNGIVIFDKTGTIMARYPAGLTCIGMNLWDGGILQAALAKGKGVYDGTGMLGDKRIYAFEHFAGTQSYIAVGLPKAPIMARLHRRLDMALGGMVAIILTATLVGLVGAEILILRPLTRLTQATQIVASGQFDDADGLDARLPALSRVMRSFHTMAQKIKAREAELRHHREILSDTRRYLSLAEQVGHVGNWRVEFPANTVFWSDEVYRIHGIDPKIFTPTLATAIAAFHPEDRAEALRHIALARAQHCDFEFTLRILRPGGEVRHITSRGFCELGSDGEVSSLFGAMVDVTALKEIQAKLKR